MLRVSFVLVLVLLVSCGGGDSEPAAPVDHGAGSVVKVSEALGAIVPDDYKIEKIGEGFGFIEGPVWVKDGSYLLFSDIPANTIFQWTPSGGAIPFLKPVYGGDTTGKPRQTGSNGLTLDLQGRLVMCEHGNRQVSRMELSGGEREVLADRYQGKRLNSPNDLVFRSDGNLYFTDPPYGLRGQDEAENKELDFNGIYRLSPEGELFLVSSALERPNGIALSPDEKTLYVANSFATRKIWMAFDVASDGSVSNGRTFFDATAMEGRGGPDGMTVDTTGNLYCTGPGGVLVFSPGGEHLGTIEANEQPANCAFGDDDGKTLYMTARTGLYRVGLKIPGLMSGPK